MWQQEGRGETMNLQQQVIIGLLVVYVAAIIGVFIMKKIEPDNWFYPVYATIVCIVLTYFLVRYAF